MFFFFLNTGVDLNWVVLQRSYPRVLYLILLMAGNMFGMPCLETTSGIVSQPHERPRHHLRQCSFLPYPLLGSQSCHSCLMVSWRVRCRASSVLSLWQQAKWWPKATVPTSPGGSRPLGQISTGNQGGFLQKVPLPGSPRYSGPLFERERTFSRTTSLVQVFKMFYEGLRGIGLN